MNIMTSEKFVDLNDDTTSTENPALKRMMKQWEKKIKKNALRVGGFGLIAVSLSACGGDSNSIVDPELPVEPANGVWSLVAGGLQLAGNFDPALFAGGAFPVGVLIGNPAVLTPTGSNFVQGGGLPGAGDDLVLASSGSFLGARIDLGAGDDTIFISVTRDTVSGLVTNVETVELSNIANNSIPGIGGTPTIFATSIVNLSNVVNIDKVVISEASVAGNALQVVGIRNTATIELQGNFNNNLFIDFLNATGPLNLILNDYFQNIGLLNIAQDFTTVNLTSTGEGTLNAIDSGALGDNLQALNIFGDVDLEVNSAIAFRPNTEAKIDASEFTGDNLNLTVAAHNDVAFTGSDANDTLSVTTASAAFGTDIVITLTADFGAGDNTLIVNGGGFVNADSSIVSAGALELVVNGALDMTQIPAAGLAAITSVVVNGGTLTLTAAQVAEIGVENFATPNFGGVFGAINVTVTGDEALDFSDIEVGIVFNVRVGPGDVTLNAATVLGNANAGVLSITVDNRGQDSTVTMTAEQFQQLDGTGTVEALGGPGTNNPATNEAYTTGLILTDLDPDTAYNLLDVSTDTTDVQLTDFTAGANFAIFGAGGTELTVTLAGTVDLSEVTGAVFVNNLVLADGVILTVDPTTIFFTLNDDLVIEGAATLNLLGDNTFLPLDTDSIVGDASQMVLNFVGTGFAQIDVFGSADITLKAVNTGDDITVLIVQNFLEPGATLEITGGSPALMLGEDTLTLNIFGAEGTTTLIGSDADNPDIVSATLTTINAFAVTDAVIDLGELSVTSDALTVNGDGSGVVMVEIIEVPAGAAWVFNGVELEINAGAIFGPGATIKLGPDVTLTGDFDIAMLPLTSDSIVPLDASFTAEQINAILQSLEANQATVNVTDFTLEQLEAVINNSLKVANINGDLTLTSDLTVFQINTLSGLYNPGTEDVLTIDADGMSAAQKAAASQASLFIATTVVNLSLDSDDSPGTIELLLANTALNSTAVDATDMNAAQLNALVADIVNVQVITNMTLTDGNDSTQITALLSQAAPLSVTVDAELMDNDQFAALVQQITKIDVVENLNVTNISPAELFQVTALLELAVDATVDAAGMSNLRLSEVADNIANIAADGITNLTVSADQTTAEIAALVSKAPDGSVVVDLSDMSADQVAAVVVAAVKVANLSVGEDSSVTLTLAQFNALDTAGLTPIIGEQASGPANTGGSITIVAAVNGTLDLALVGAGEAAGGTAGTLTLQINAGVRLSIENPTTSDILSLTGTGTLVVTTDLDLSALDLSVAAGITIELAAADPGVTVTLTAEQASELANDGVTITKAAAVLPAVAGQIEAAGGVNNSVLEPEQDLSALNLSLVDVLILQDPQGTILSGSPADLPAQIGTGFLPKLLVVTDTDWSGYTGTIRADTDVSADATLTLSAATASGITAAGVFVTGEVAGAGETGGSIVITGLENGVVYNLNGVFNEGLAGGGDAGTFVVSIASNVTLEAGTILPPAVTAAQIVIDAGATLTVDSDTAAQVDGTNAYEGAGTLNFVDLDGNPVTATGDVRFNTFTFETTDNAVTINGFEAINIGGFNGRFLFDASTNPDTLGLMSLDLTSFATNGAGFVPVADIAALNALSNISTSGVIVIGDGADPTGQDLKPTIGAEDAQVFFAIQNGLDVEIQYWNDDDTGNGDGVVDVLELTLVATLIGTNVDQLGSENFVV